MGRKPNALVQEFFERGSKLPDSSNRYEHTCKRCGEHFPKGRSDSLMNHLLKKCPAVTQEDRQVVFMFLQSGGDSRPFVFPGHGGNIAIPLPQLNHNFGSDGANDRMANEPKGAHNLDASRQSLPSTLQRNQSALDTLAEVSRQYGSQQISGTMRQDIGADDAQRTIFEQTLFSEMEKAGVSTMPRTSNETSGLYMYPTDSDAQQQRQSFDIPLLSGEALTSSPLVRAATAANHHLEHHAAQQAQASEVDPRLNDCYQQSIQQSSEQSHDFNLPARDQTGFTWNPTTPSGRNVTFGNLSTLSNEPTPGFGLLQKANKTKSRGRFSDDRRKEVQEIRKRGACIRCRMLKKPCSEGTPCVTCKNIEVARLWKSSCIRTRIAEEFTLWSTSLFHSWAKTSVLAAVQGLDNRRMHGRIEVRLFPNSETFISFPAKQYSQNLGVENIDPNLHDGMFPRDDEANPVLLLDEGEGIDDKVSYLCKNGTFLDAKVDAEPIPFIRATLRQARLLAETEMTDSAAQMAQDPQAARSGYNMPNLLLKNVIELWTETSILSNSGELDLAIRYNASSPPDHPPEMVSWAADHDIPVSTKPILPDSPSHRHIKAQLLAATESRCSRLSKAVMNELELRLLQRRQVSGFATFISAVVLLSCVGRMTGFYCSLDPVAKVLPQSSQPPVPGNSARTLPPDWPLDIPPSALWLQGSHFANLLIMLLHMRALPPKVTQTTEGKLKVLQESVLPAKVNVLLISLKESEAEQMRLAAAWLDPLELKVRELVEKRDSALWSALPLTDGGGERSSSLGNEWDMVFVARALLSEMEQRHFPEA